MEGERAAPAPVPVTAAIFNCCLFIPLGGESESAAGKREVSRPQLLYLPEDQAGVPVVLREEDSLLVTAAELNLARGLAETFQEEWRVDGAPQPFGPPGELLVGWQVRLLKAT